MFRTLANGLRPAWGGKLSAHIRAVIETARRRAIAAREARRRRPAGMPLAHLA